jgi:DNA-binding IclR family transcriptional regulator
MTDKGNTASYRILEYLTRNRGTAFTNRQIGEALNLPADSIRRVINVLRAQLRVKQGPYDRYWQIA